MKQMLKSFVFASIPFIAGTPLLSSTKQTGFSQFKQDVFVNEHVFKNKENGIFVDIGAADGVNISNSLFFERYFGWSGICIEPRQKDFDELVKNRECICVKGCITNVTGEQDFLVVEGYAAHLSGLLATYDPKHLARIDREIKKYGGSKRIVKMPCYRLDDLLREHEITYVDYLSIDTEGSEFEILQSIDFDACDIEIIDVENNYKEPKFSKFLAGKGYKLVHRLGVDEIYQKIR